MSNYIEAARTGEVQDGGMKKVNVQGQEIMLARVGDKYYAVQNRCSHMGGDLSAGTLQGTIVTCPLHGSQYDITDGHNVRWLKGQGFVAAVGKIFKPPRPIRAYNVKIEGDIVSVEI